MDIVYVALHFNEKIALSLHPCYSRIHTIEKRQDCIVQHVGPIPCGRPG